MHLTEALQLTSPLDGESADTKHHRLSVHQVLYVDDAADVRRMTGMMLRKAGFAVTLAASGDEALGLLAAGGPFDALVTDYAMPGLNGLALVELALDRDPSLPALIVTGYIRDAEFDRLPARVPVLTKPFTRAEFVQQVEILVRPRRTPEPA
jgi:CheY-like chemotaxis protein